METIPVTFTKLTLATNPKVFEDIFREPCLEIAEQLKADLKAIAQKIEAEIMSGNRIESLPAKAKRNKRLPRKTRRKYA